MTISTAINDTPDANIHDRVLQVTAMDNLYMWEVMQYYIGKQKN